MVDWRIAPEEEAAPPPPKWRVVPEGEPAPDVAPALPARPSLGERAGAHFQRQFWGVDTPTYGLGSELAIKTAAGGMEQATAEDYRAQQKAFNQDLNERQQRLLSIVKDPAKRAELQQRWSQNRRIRDEFVERQAQKVEETGQQKATASGEKQQRIRERFAALPDAEGFLEKGAVVAGHVGALLAQPENYIPIGSGGATVARRFGRGALAGGGITAATEPIIQESAMQRGVQDEADLGAAAINIGASGVLGGALNVLPGAGRAIARNVRRVLARRRNAPEASISDAEVASAIQQPDEELSALIQRERQTPEASAERVSAQPTERAPAVADEVPINTERLGTEGEPPLREPVEGAEAAARAAPEAELTLTPKMAKKRRAVQGDVLEWGGVRYRISELHGRKGPVVMEDVRAGVEQVFESPAQFKKETGYQLNTRKLDDMDRRLKEFGDEKQYPSLSERIASNGGIRRIDAYSALGEGVVRGYAEAPGMRRVFQKSGRPADQMREVLEADGYLPENSTLNDMFELVDQDLGARAAGTESRVYLPGDREQVAEIRAVKQQAAERLEQARLPVSRARVNQPSFDQQQARIREGATKAGDVRTWEARMNEALEQASIDEEARVLQEMDDAWEAEYDELAREFGEREPGSLETVDDEVGDATRSAQESGSTELGREGAARARASGTTEPAAVRGGESEIPAGQGRSDATAARGEGTAQERGLSELQQTADQISEQIGDMAPEDRDVVADALELGREQLDRLDQAPPGGRVPGAPDESPREFLSGVKEKVGGARVVKSFVFSMDGHLRSAGRTFAKRYNAPRIKEITGKIADVFYDMNGIDYWTRYRTRMHSAWNRATDILAPLKTSQRRSRTGVSKGEIPEEVSKRVWKLAQGRAVDNATDAERAVAAKVQAWFQEQWEYRRAAGEDVGRVVNENGENVYVPAMLDEAKVREARELFLEQAKIAYRRVVEDDETAEKSAQALLDGLLEDEYVPGLVPGEFNPMAVSGSFKRERVFTEQMRRDLEDFYITDIEELMHKYNMSASKAAEQTRSNAVLKPLLEELDDELVTLQRSGTKTAYPLKETILNIIERNFQNPRVMSDERLFTTFASQYTYVASMGKTLITSGPEPLLLPVQLGTSRHSVKAMLKSYTDVIRLARSDLKGTTYEEKAWAEWTGAITDPLNDTLMSNRLNLDAWGTKAAELGNRFFHGIYLAQFTRNQRIWATHAGRFEIARQVARLAKGGRKGQNAARELRELGFTDVDRLKGFLDEHDGVPSLDVMKTTTDPIAEEYRLALNKVSSLVVMEPTRAQKPLKASQNPMFGLIYSLQSYSMSFLRNVTYRQARKTWRGLKEGDFAAAANLAFWLPMYIAGIAGLESARGQLYGKEYRDKRAEESWARFMARVVDRGALLGPYISTAQNAVIGSRYERDLLESFAGPFYGRIADGGMKGAAQLWSRNSPNTNSAERRAAYGVYDTVIGPALNGSVAMAPVPNIVKAPYFMWGQDQVREAFVDSTAGKKEN